MAAKSTGTAALPTTDATEYPTVEPGSICPCCGRKVPVNATSKLSPEEQAARRHEYNQRPDVKERRKAYNAKRNEELRELRRIQRELQAQAESETQDEPA